MSVAHMPIVTRLGRDPELRTTSSGKTMCTLSLPTETGWGDNKKTTWWKATVWGKRAEAAAKYLSKGSWVCVQGKAGVEEWTTRENEKRSTPVIEVNDWSFVGPKQQGSVVDGFVQRRAAPPSEATDFADVPF